MKRFIKIVRVHAVLPEGNAIVNMATTGSEYVDGLFNLKNTIIQDMDINIHFALDIDSMTTVSRSRENRTPNLLTLTANNLVLNRESVLVAPSPSIDDYHIGCIVAFEEDDRTEYFENAETARAVEHELLPEILESKVREILENKHRMYQTSILIHGTMLKIGVICGKAKFSFTTRGFNTYNHDEEIGDIPQNKFLDERTKAIQSRVDNMELIIDNEQYKGENLANTFNIVSKSDIFCKLDDRHSIYLTAKELEVCQLSEYFTWTLFAFIVSGDLTSYLINKHPNKNPNSDLSK